MVSPKDSLSSRGLHRLAEFVYRRSRWLTPPLILAAVACVVFTRYSLQFHTSRNDLVGGNLQYHRQFLQFRDEFPAQDDLVALVESEDHEKNRQFVERLAARLQAETNLFTNVFFKGDLKLLGPKALLFLPEEKLDALARTLEDAQPLIRQFAQATNLSSMLELVNRQFAGASPSTNESTSALLGAIPALRRILDQAAQSLRRPGVPPSPGVSALFNDGQEAESQMYITFDNGRIYLVTAQPRLESLNHAAVDRLRELVRATRYEVPGVNAGITGESVLSMDEMAQSQRDTLVASVLSLILVALIFVYGYQETGRPLKATVCLVIGLAYTMAFATGAIGHLNILTITFVPMLIGLAIDFGVHLITRYEEELRHGHTRRDAIEKAIVFTGKGIFTGCFTTAFAFLAMGFTGFRGIQEMGWICGGGLLICLIPMMTILPAWLLRGRQNRQDHRHPPPNRRALIERLWLDRPRTVLVVALAVSTLAITQLPKVYFDYNLLHLQTRGLPAVALENKLIHSAGKSVLFGAVLADSLTEAVEIERQIQSLPTVSTVESIGPLLADDPSRRLPLIRQVKECLAPLRFPPLDPDPVSLPDLDYPLRVFIGYLSLALPEIERAEDPLLAAQVRSLIETATQFRSSLQGADRPAIAHRLAAYQQALFRDLRDTLEALRNQDDRAGLRIEDLPATIRNRFVGRTGKYLLQVYPKSDVWERANQEAFIRSLREILDPNQTGHPIITGTPVQLYEYTTLLKNSYEEAALYSLAAIVLLTAVHFRSALAVLFAIIPVAVGSLWTLGIMGACDAPFNPANIMLLPLIVGIGVTNGIHILNRFAEERNPGILAKSTGKALVVSALTTIAGFGSLTIAQHQGIASLGFVMAIGTLCCLVAALTLLPACLKIASHAGWKIKTQWRQCTIDTGHRGTEAKAPPSLMLDQ